MSFCCCGKLRKRWSKNRAKEIHAGQKAPIAKSEDLNNNKKQAEPLKPKDSLTTQKSLDSGDYQTEVILRNEQVRQKIIFSEPEVGFNRESSFKKLGSTRSSSSILKSIIHKNTRFDEDEVRQTQTATVSATKHAGKSSQQNPFVAASRRGSLYIFRAADDVIITPFAQILASLRKVRANFMLIATNDVDTTGQTGSIKSQKTESVDDVKTTDTSSNDGELKEQKLANETLKELEWCLDRLENIQTYRSVSDMASTKFKQIINRELNQSGDSSKSGHQVSDYICKTFLDSPATGGGEDEVAAMMLEDRQQQEATEARLQQQQQQQQRAQQTHPYRPLQKANTEPSLSRTARFGSLNSDTIREEEVGEATDTTENTKTDSDDVDNGPSQVQEDRLVELPFGVIVKDEAEVKEIIDRDLTKWGMNLFDFTAATANQPLVVLSLAIFKQHNLANKFQIDHSRLLQFLLRVEARYRPNVPYHNSIHATDVTQSANVLLGCPALENVFSDLEILSVIVASIVHDMDHPGVTNQYLINTGSELATLYNDCSVLENHHLATAFSLLSESGCDILTGLSRRQRQSLRRMVIDMVLATDMSKHMTLLADLKTMVETKKVAGSGILTLDTYQDRIQILQNLVHCADLSNPTKPLLLYQAWTDRIMQEFFLQGDKERSLQLEISPMCDRQTASIEKSQVSFIDFIVHPLWETWTELVYPDTQGILETLEANRQWYLSQIPGEDPGGSS